MDYFSIKTSFPLKGSVKIGGAKNAALPIMCASLLTDGEVHLTNLPDLQDVRFMLKILENMGCDISTCENSARILAIKPKPIADYDLVRKMRASILVLGPLIARFGQAQVSLPGGCAIGARPVNIHLEGLEKLGASIKLEGGYVYAKADRLRGNHIDLKFPSVGATENLLMAASLADGETLITNCAKEPEIVDLAKCLKSMGAIIEGEGTAKISIQGVTQLNKCSHEIMPDRIEAATFMIASAITCGELVLTPYPRWILQSVEDVLIEMGVYIEHSSSGVIIKGREQYHSFNFETLPFPGFPTDAQAQLMALLCFTPGNSKVSETIFENRFMHVPELIRMGAKIRLAGNTAYIKSVDKLIGAPVMATDLRASAALVLAGLKAEGETTLQRVYHIDRGYEKIEEKLSKVGADITRLS